MTSERVQRQIDRLLDEAEQAAAARDWSTVKERAEHALTFDPENADAKALLSAADRGLAAAPTPAIPQQQSASALPVPSSFVNGRYQVRRFLGEGGKKKVYLAHDTLLDRDVAFALIKTEGLDQAARERITREAQAMGRLGDHPNIVTVYDIGDEAGHPPLPLGEGRGEGPPATQPFLVLPIMAGGDIEGLIEKAADHKLPIEQAVRIAVETCQGLEFAHAKGIVHRDIKPGNVWLAEDVSARPEALEGRVAPLPGSVKIGDFGLAVAVDRSRLTQAGMMVGTVSYMPPEQAMGGEVGPRSDLYSLGAMLYEMVCGRPPFAGEDYVAIISQHLNTPPVAPSWHRSDLPPSLEALILRLLEKDPAKRPSSASAVHEALQAIDLSAPVATPSGTNPLERVARGVFVGRERELSRLRAAWDDAFAGRGGVVMLVGEPGIGKTRTAQELETYARIRGGQVLWGRAHEGAGAPSYWPWVQAIRSYTAATEPEALRAQLGAAATEVARIVSELRERLPELPEPSPITDPEQAQFRLFDAVSGFLRNASTATPLLVILDDLHWADRPTLLLLQHLAGDIGRSRLLLLGSYRDVEVGRQHPLAEVLAELNREQLFQRILLRGLSREEVEQYIRASASFDPARGLLESMYQETEGNPFFLSEVVALMAQEGTLGVRGAATVPQGVREVLGRRLDRLSAECNELLGLAAIVGREFGFELLAALSERDDERLLGLVEEALKGRVVEETERPGEYRFAHALVQETLLGELSTTRRVRIHGRVAETMETYYGDQAERHAAELAVHFSESATLTRSHARQAAHYSRLAGEQAEADAGWGEAARHYRRVLALMEETREDLGQDEAALTLSLGCCERALRELGDAHSHFRRAMELSRARGDATGVARALVQATENLAFRDSLAPGEAEGLAKDALDFLGDRDPYLRATLLARLCTWTMDEALFREAEAIAERLGYFDIEAELLVAKRAFLNSRFEFELGLQATLSLKTIWEQAGNRPRLGEALYYVAVAKVHLSLDAGEAAANEALAFAGTFRLRTWELGATLILETVGFLRGDLSEKDSPVLAVPRESAATNLGRIALNLRAFRREASGDIDAALAVLPHPDKLPAPGMRATVLASVVRLQSHAGQSDAASRSFASYQQANSGTVSPQLSVFSVPEVFFDDALTLLADEEFVEKVYRLLQSQPHVNFLVSAAIGLDHVRGALALRLGLVDEAEAHYRTGLEWSLRERAVLEEGRCLQGLAAVAEVRGDKQTQAEHLDRAAALFQRIGANLYLKQVLAKKDVLKA